MLCLVRNKKYLSTVIIFHIIPRSNWSNIYSCEENSQCSWKLCMYYYRSCHLYTNGIVSYDDCWVPSIHVLQQYSTFEFSKHSFLWLETELWLLSLANNFSLPKATIWYITWYYWHIVMMLIWPISNPFPETNPLIGVFPELLMIWCQQWKLL